tara:strand:+ start:232 stop:366 length:135 start_codon:yes stop_codon:yes gene_type:complete
VVAATAATAALVIFNLQVLLQATAVAQQVDKLVALTATDVAAAM